jgi:OmcA/MtrC family decaheme c-type cytochrome
VVVNGVGRDIVASPLGRLRFTIAGPTTDYQEYYQVTAQNNGATSAGAVITAIDSTAGRFTYTFPVANPIPASASGSYALGIEANIPSAAGTVNLFNPVAYFAVTDPAPVARRQVVDQAGCDSCHLALEEHGGSRRNAEYCVMCHNPLNTNDERVAAFEGTTQVVGSVDFKVMIHGIHTGEDHDNPYVLGGYPPPSETNPAGSPIDFGEVRFPGDRRACGTCHVAGSFALPLGNNVLPTRFETLTCTEAPGTDADDFCESRTSVEFLMPPTRAVCTSCHDSDSSAAHAEIMTTLSGVESCATCHGPGSAFDIAEYHRLDP